MLIFIFRWTFGFKISFRWDRKWLNWGVGGRPLESIIFLVAEDFLIWIWDFEAIPTWWIWFLDDDRGVALLEGIPLKDDFLPESKRLTDELESVDDDFLLIILVLALRIGVMIMLSFRRGRISGMSCSVNIFNGSWDRSEGGLGGAVERGLAGFIVSSVPDDVALSLDDNEEAVSPIPESDVIVLCSSAWSESSHISFWWICNFK